MSVKRRLPVREGDWRPIYVVWELTLRCDQPCTHCGSRAGDPRESELDTEAALAVVPQLAALRAEEIALIGGEAYLHPGFLTLVRAITAHGMRATMTTGGRGIDAALAREMKAAGLYSVSVSVDGLEPTHDLMRAARGSFRSACATLGHLKDAGITITANTNVNRLNAPEIEPLYEHLRTLGIVGWQVQLTTPLGRAADRPDMVVQPYDLLDLLPRIRALKERAFAEGILLMPGNNLGYFGPEEATLRSTQPGGTDHYRGCAAGRFLMGIESSGDVKGCPSLQSTPYVGGNLRQRPLASIWNDSLTFTRSGADAAPSAHQQALWGFCKQCAFAEPCRGGCTFTSHAILGRPGNNPYCHFRAREHAKQGLRERLVRVAAAPGEPFDNGRFEIVLEPLDAPDPRPRRPLELVQLRRRDRPA